MFNVCARCGAYRAEKTIDPDGPFAECPQCGHRHRFRQLPMFVITGPSGAGKTSVCLELATDMDDVITLDSDILWRQEFVGADDDYRQYREIWLRVCKNISQAGRPVVLCGCAVPSQFEPCVERRYFTALHYLALVCDDDVLAKRLRARPQWRDSGSEGYIQDHLRFNRWLKDNAKLSEPAIDLLDTTDADLSETVAAVREWIRGRPPGHV